MVKHVPCAISWWFTSLSCSKAVYPLVVNRVNYTNYPGIRVSSLRIPEESLDMNAGSPQFLDLSCANPHVCVCVCVCIVYLYIISYADVCLPVYTHVLKLNTGCTSSVTSLAFDALQKVNSCTIPDQIFCYQKGSKNYPFSKHSPKVCPELYSVWLGESNFLLANSGCQPQGLPIVHSWTICAGEIPNPHLSNTHKSVYPEQRCRFVKTWESGLLLA